MSQKKIAIEGIRIYAYHGYYELERTIGREFLLDVYIVFHPGDKDMSDQLEDTVDYETIIKICSGEMAITSKLLEPVAHRIGHQIKLLSDGILMVTVRINKQFPMLPVQIDRFFVEITQ